MAGRPHGAGGPEGGGGWRGGPSRPEGPGWLRRPAPARQDVGGDPAVGVPVGDRVGVAHADPDARRVGLALEERPQELGTEGPVQLVGPPSRALADRSEEHTSELQSQSNIVCRLLLEKKKKK